MLMDFEGLGGRLGLLLIIALAAMVGLVATCTSAQSSSTSHVPQGFGGQQSPGFPGPQQQPLPTPEVNTQPSLSPKQKQELLKSGFQQMKKDSDQLLELARSLQKDLDKTNQNVLSVKVVDKAERIEKLAKKIKNTARGY